MPIRARIDMMVDGHSHRRWGSRSYGDNPLTEMAKVAREVEQISVRAVPDHSAPMISERVIGGYYLDITPNRCRLGRYGTVRSRRSEVIGILGRKRSLRPLKGRERSQRRGALPCALALLPRRNRAEVQVCLRPVAAHPLGRCRHGLSGKRGATSIRTLENGQLAVLYLR